MPHTVLLVDDDPNVLDGLSRALRKEPYEIATAASAEAALALMDAQPVDVVVADQNMPGMNGTELLARIRASYPKTMRLMLTGAASVEVAIRAINMGEIFRFMTKPCDPDEVGAAIRQAIQQKELEVQSRRLLGTVREQRAILDKLEEENPGITHVKRAADGAVVLEEGDSGNVSDFLKEIARENERPRRGAQPGGGVSPRGARRG
jgi:DNA-binding NtrC family response regulator